jgi:hypothetical protein
LRWIPPVILPLAYNIERSTCWIFTRKAKKKKLETWPQLCSPWSAEKGKCKESRMRKKNKIVTNRFEVKRLDGNSVAVFSENSGDGYYILRLCHAPFGCPIGVQTVEQVKTEIAKLYNVDFDSVAER